MSYASRKEEEDRDFARTFGFIHEPRSCYELYNSTVQSPLQTRDQGKLASKSEIKDYESYLQFPNAHLERNYLLYEKYKSSPVEKEKYDEYVGKNKELYQLIIGAQWNCEEWFKWITLADNEKFIRLNIEYRLSRNISDQWLWKRYIQFLKDTNRKEMLQLYSKYCRYFSRDEKALKEYWNAAKLYGPVYVGFSDLFHFEKPALQDPSLPRFFKQACLIQSNETVPETFFTPENAANQTWPFKSPLMRYILQNATVTVLSKLHQSCKYFYIKKPILLCHRFVLTDDIALNEGQEFLCNENSMHCDSNIIRHSKSKNLLITTSLYVDFVYQKMLPQFIADKFYKCYARHIDIKNQDLTEDEFDFLVGHGNVETCCLEFVDIFKNDRKLLLLDEILTKMPMLRYFSASLRGVTNESLEKLPQLQFENKIVWCSLSNFRDTNIVLQPLFDFIIKNAAPVSTFSFYFRENVHQLYHFENRMNQLFRTQWNLKQEKPKIVVSQFSPIF